MTGAGDAGPGVAEPTPADLNDAFSMISAMERADQASSVRLIRLVDGVETWEGCAGDERQDFDFRDDAAEWVADRRREVRARALVRAMKAWRDLALAAAARSASSPQDEGEALRSSAGLSRQDLLDALASSHEQQVAAERERDEARAELVLLDEVCAHYALDEARFLRDEGEPFGSAPVEAGMKARQAGRRYAEREAAELAERRSASERVLADPTADEFDRHDARFAIECVGYALERIAPLRAAALDPPPRGATGPSGTRDGQGEAADGGEGGGGAGHGS